MHVLPVEKRCCFMRNALLIKTAKSHSVRFKSYFSKAQISTHLECMGISNGKNMTFNNEFIVNICRVWNSVYSRKCRISIMLR